MAHTVNGISSAEKEAIKNKSPYGMPDSPSAQKWTTAETKGGFYKFVTDTTHSVFAEIDRIASEASAMSADTAHIDDSAVTSAKIAAAAIITTLLADGAVTTAKIADDAVTGAKVADGAIDTAHLAAGAVETAKIENGNVTTAKIADGNVTTAKIADGNVTTAKMADGNVTTAKVADGAITDAKLAGSIAQSKVVGLADLSDDAFVDAALSGTSILFKNTDAETVKTLELPSALAKVQTVDIAGDMSGNAQTCNKTNTTIALTSGKKYLLFYHGDSIVHENIISYNTDNDGGGLVNNEHKYEFVPFWYGQSFSKSRTSDEFTTAYISCNGTTLTLHANWAYKRESYWQPITGYYNGSIHAVLYELG